MIIFSISVGSTLSFEAWMRDKATSSAPHRMTSARGQAWLSELINGWTRRSRWFRPGGRTPRPAGPRRLAPSSAHVDATANRRWRW